MKNKKQDPYEVQLADLANELGGNMAVEYYNVSFSLTKEQLQDMKDKGLRTDIMSCIMAALIMNGKNEAEIKAFLEEAHQAGAAPSVTFEAPDDGALNVTSPEEYGAIPKEEAAITNLVLMIKQFIIQETTKDAVRYLTEEKEKIENRLKELQQGN